MPHSLCPACEVEPFTRNHYFTGKLLLERDFTTEQNYAIDCCGREIMVPRPELIDLLNLPAIKTLQQSTERPRDHVLQICVRYRECPTEEIPVLYDECGCDDTRCEPNRVLESY